MWSLKKNETIKKHTVQLREETTSVYNLNKRKSKTKK